MFHTFFKHFTLYKQFKTLKMVCVLISHARERKFESWQSLFNCDVIIAMCYSKITHGSAANKNTRNWVKVWQINLPASRFLIGWLGGKHFWLLTTEYHPQSEEIETQANDLLSASDSSKALCHKPQIILTANLYTYNNSYFPQCYLFTANFYSFHCVTLH